MPPEANVLREAIDALRLNGTAAHRLADAVHNNGVRMATLEAVIEKQATEIVRLSAALEARTELEQAQLAASSASDERTDAFRITVVQQVAPVIAKLGFVVGGAAAAILLQAVFGRGPAVDMVRLLLGDSP